MKYAFIILSFFVFSCNQPLTKQQDKIRVIGEGKVRAKPNLVILTLQVSFTKPSMAEAVSLTQATVDTVLAILGTYKKKEEDIKTSSVSANKQYYYNGRQEVFRGYKAEQSINFVLNDIEKFTQLIGQLLGTKISSISGIQFGHSNADSLSREADLLAYDDALKSAKKLCNRAKVKLGKVLFMSNAQEGTSDYSGAFEVSAQVEMNTFAKGFGGRGFKISPEVLEFKRTILSEYELVQ